MAELVESSIGPVRVIAERQIVSCLLSYVFTKLGLKTPQQGRRGGSTPSLEVRDPSC